MKKSIFLVALLFQNLYSELKNEPDLPQALFNAEEIKEISKHLAHLLEGELQTFSPYYDFNEVVHMMAEIEKGHLALIPSKDSYIALVDFRHKILEDQAYKELDKANRFLSELAARKGIIEIEKGKLYYEILQKGFGDIITEDLSPLIHFTEYNLSGVVIQDTKKSGAQRVCLKQIILGLRQGMRGMAIGEKRKIYIHPDLAYGKIGKEEPQQLAIFDIEVLDK